MLNTGIQYFPDGFHADVAAVVEREPFSKAAQVAREGRETLAFVSGYKRLVCRRDTRDYEGFVDVDSTADWINDFRHKHPLKIRFEENGQGLNVQRKTSSQSLQR